jgi:hypothetical protein
MHNITLLQEMNDVMALAPKILQAKTVPADVFAVFLCGSLKLLFANYYVVFVQNRMIFSLILKMPWRKGSCKDLIFIKQESIKVPLRGI